jgi:hypothetical protein
MTTEHKTRYQVTAFMVQLTGPYSAGSAFSTGIETVFRQGDILPEWAGQNELDRLAAYGLIEALAA